jgi:hypothetical protein
VISIRITPSGRVDCRAALRSPLSPGQVWGQIRDFRTYARQEFFHAEIEIGGGIPRAGATLQLTHRFLGFRLQRVGRICRWKEGDGFAFSDLSCRGVQSGFPHTFSYRLRAANPAGCKVEIRVAGKWTASKIPRWLAWLWLRWIMQFAAQRVENNLLAYQLWLARKNRATKKSPQR